MPFFLLQNVKMPTIVGILTFVSRKNLMLNSVEHEKSFITSGPVHYLHGIEVIFMTSLKYIVSPNSNWFCSVTRGHF